MKDKIAIGKILTAHGVNGFVKVTSFSGETEHFKKLKAVYTDKNNSDCCLNIDQIKIAHKNILIKFSGIDTPEKAKDLRNIILWTEIENACELNNDEYYFRDICSCSIIMNNNQVGTVKSVFEGANSDNLEVILNNRKTVIIPFINQFVGEVNIKEKKIYIKEDCGLI